MLFQHLQSGFHLLGYKFNLLAVSGGTIGFCQGDGLPCSLLIGMVGRTHHGATGDVGEA
jgi:hypothetical protein